MKLLSKGSVKKCKQRLDKLLVKVVRVQERQAKKLRKPKEEKSCYKMGLSRASLWKETKVLFHPYYWINIILCGSFVFMRLVSPFCQILFGPGKEACELDMRENEILFFLLVIVMVKSRKSGATSTAAAYLASGFIYAKVWKF